MPNLLPQILAEYAYLSCWFERFVTPKIPNFPKSEQIYGKPTSFFFVFKQKSLKFEPSAKKPKNRLKSPPPPRYDTMPHTPCPTGHLNILVVNTCLVHFMDILTQLKKTIESAQEVLYPLKLDIHILLRFLKEFQFVRDQKNISPPNRN